MNVDTLQALAALFPIVILTLVVERRAVHTKLLKRPWVRQMFAVGVTSSLTGTVFAIIGLAVKGLSLPFAAWLWTLFAIAMATFAVAVLAMVATSEAREERGKKSK